MDYPLNTSAACTQCAAPLQVPFALRRVTCDYCGTTQDNPQPLPIGQDVMVTQGPGTYTLGRVTACAGPDEITIEDSPSRHILEDLIPVTTDGIEPNMRVFWCSGDAWKLTWTAKVSGQTCVVKHPNPSFQGNVFNKTVTLDDVRIPVQAELQERRTVMQGWLDQAKGNPKKFVFNLVWYGVLVLIVYRLVTMFFL